MPKVTPNPPQDPSVSPYEGHDSRKLHQAAERALDFHLQGAPATAPKPNPGDLFTVNPSDNETLLAYASETLASLNVLASDLAFELEGSRRHVALAIQQLAVLSGLLVNRALDNVDPFE
ncbi:hypothetical protein SAMN04487857_12115 [Pseudomonas sp. ok272]|uniref:DUF6124 family protein n=1 Tax=unclassified Pseudomonas TaxID=196821 RepID=UPI0008C5C807|nr:MULTISPECIES: DUF6124 family protein [unclassified Pseudomonas]SEN53802.1 hypothetical protein SAMN04487857_12115 [Pseudomonas sp. ok272]SFN35341.1 hypothetical protein SAMN04487858_12147 [Pseudomonas sp. ok602]